MRARKERAVSGSLLAGLLAGVLVLAGAGTAEAGVAAGGTAVLYDTGGPYGAIGEQYAILLSNLLGHFPTSVRRKPVTEYLAGEIQAADVTFYLGSTFDEPSYFTGTAAERYRRFLSDVAASTKPVVWLGSNLHLLDGDPGLGPGFRSRFGVAFAGNFRGRGDDPEKPYNRVSYKGEELYKGVVPLVFPGANLQGCRLEDPLHPERNADCDGLLGVVSILDAEKVSVVATAYATADPQRVAAPYVTRAANLWYVGDIPFRYVSEEDRYLAFADLLHDMLGVAHAVSHRALVRLEDVSPVDDPQSVQACADALGAVPFGVAVIPIYRDPDGVYNGGVAEAAKLADTRMAAKLRALVRTRGASIVQHGTTHQWDGAPNPYTRVSGDDFEFFQVAQNSDSSLDYRGPIPGDGAKWAKNRIAKGKQELTRAGLLAFAWEAPHYLASRTDYKAIKTHYPTHWGRMSYFSASGPNRPLGQFFPYSVADTYGAVIVPENIGNVEPDSFEGFPTVLPADLVRRARKARVVRDGFASFFYHPFLGTAYLRETVAGIQGLGYQFVRPCSVAGQC